MRINMAWVKKTSVAYRRLFTHSCVLQLLQIQLLLFATTIYLSKMIDPSKKHAH